MAREETENLLRDLAVKILYERVGEPGSLTGEGNHACFRLKQSVGGGTCCAEGSLDYTLPSGAALSHKTDILVSLASGKHVAVELVCLSSVTDHRMATTQLKHQNPRCPKCDSPKTVKKGKRRNVLRTVQMFQCKKCLHRFTGIPDKHKTHPLKLILNAISTFDLGYSPRPYTRRNRSTSSISALAAVASSQRFSERWRPRAWICVSR